MRLDIKSGEHQVWAEEGTYPGEPIFVPRPGGTEEDDGVLLSVVLAGQRYLDQHAGWGWACIKRHLLLHCLQLSHDVFSVPNPMGCCCDAGFTHAVRFDRALTTKR